MGKYSDFPSQTSKVRPKSVIYTPKRDDKHPDHFDMGVPTPLPGGGGGVAETQVKWARSYYIKVFSL